MNTKRIAFLHPDLGIGGAERAIIDAAMALKSKQFDITMFTNHHDVNHCFEETKNGDLKIIVIGDSIPRSAFGRFCAFFAYLRLLFAALYIILFQFYQFDLIYVDQISAPVPLLKLFGFKVLFYAHFPDFLLSKRGGKWKQFYRVPIDFVEKWSLSYADVILYNSKFTGSVFQQHFKFLKEKELTVLYPVPNIDNLISYNTELPIPIDANDGSLLFLSINRYEQKKNIDLAVKAFGMLRQEMLNAGDGPKLVFVHVGGYDELLQENADVFLHLTELVESLELTDCAYLLKSCPNDVKVNLLKRATALLYTPENEHFGIVPIEAMYLRCPVIAVNSGGPLETIVDGVTGFLCEPEAQCFAASMKRFVTDNRLHTEMGEAGHARVCQQFSFRAFQETLNGIVTAVMVQ